MTRSEKPPYFYPLERGKWYAYLFLAVAGTLYTIFRLQGWYLDIRTRLKFPEVKEYGGPVTEADYFWIKGFLLLFAAIVLSLAITRYGFHRGAFLFILLPACLLIWVLEIGNPYLLPADPGAPQGNFIVTLVLLSVSRILPAVFMSCALTLWGTGILFLAEKLGQFLKRQK